MSRYANWQNGEPFTSPIGKVVCVGRNYAEHAKELNNPVPAEPILFIKPATTVVPMAPQIVIPADRGEVHYELELAVLVGKPLTNATSDDALGAIAGVGLALDLTLRNLQSTLKEKGLPWEKAKAFDGACPLSTFVPPSELPMLTQTQFQLWIDGALRQDGSAADMLMPVTELLAYASRFFTLEPGDVVLTGTPKGVGMLTPGQHIEARLESLLSVTAEITV